MIGYLMKETFRLAHLIQNCDELLLCNPVNFTAVKTPDRYTEQFTEVIRVKMCNSLWF